MAASQRIEQILEVLLGIRELSPVSGGELSRNRKDVTRASADRRGINERTVADKCWRGLWRYDKEDFHIADFDALAWGWLSGSPEELIQRCLDASTSDEDRVEVRRFFNIQSGGSMGIPESVGHAHVVAAIRDIDAGAEHTFGDSLKYPVHFGLRQYASKAVVGLAIQHATGRRAVPGDFSGGRAPSQAGGFLVGLGFHVEGVSEATLAQPARLRDILRVLTRIPIPRGQLRLYRAWRDHYPAPTPTRDLLAILSDEDANTYWGLRAALSRRINDTDLTGPDGERPGLTLLVQQRGPRGEGGEDLPREDLWRAIEALPELYDYLHEHDDPWLRENADEVRPTVPPEVRAFLDDAMDRRGAEPFAEKFGRFLRWIQGRSIPGGRTDLHVQDVDAQWVDFAPTTSTGRIVLPVPLVEEWVRAAAEGHITDEMPPRQMRDLVVGLESQWASYHHGFESQLKALVAAWWTMPPAEPPAHVDLPKVHAAFRDALQEAGLRFGLEARHDEFTRAFLASVLTKRFVILTGLSGSGKSQIAMRFGEWLGPGRSSIVPVRPDWTSPEALFGFPDLLRRDPETGRVPWHTPPTLQFILRACDSEAPHLLVLDEMNLAHVERYFADLLSGMESGKGCVPDVVRLADDWVLRSDRLRPLPDNLVLIGTVNVDETTYMFSPKVLDRANTLEFRVDSKELPDDITSLTPPSSLRPGPVGVLEALRGVLTDRSWHLSQPADGAAQLGPRLKQLHTLLAEAGFEFGHRVYFEAYRFAVIHRALGGAGLDEALDLQIMQKLLPRLHGSRRRVGEVLRGLAEYCFYGVPGSHKDFEPLRPPEALTPKLPVSFDKLQRMLVKLEANQFVSFAE